MIAPTISTVVYAKTYEPRKNLHIPKALKKAQNILNFKSVTPEAMPQIWHYLLQEKGKTCDFSFGGLIIWASLFKYEYAIANNTLFIKGCAESDFSKTAFSLPIGEMPLNMSVELLRSWCDRHNEQLRFSAIPEYALESFRALSPKSILPLREWADYLYDINSLRTLSGKKMAKKRNHVNKFEAMYPDYEFKPLCKDLIPDAEKLLLQIASTNDNNDPMANAELKLCFQTLELMRSYSMPMAGGILYTDNKPAAFTIGDIKGNTLHIHIEKANRDIQGAYEAINKYFAQYMYEASPNLQYVNREDDAGSPGLRFAKESYHPLEILLKYDISF